MGSNFANDLADMDNISLTTQLDFHLRANHYPPVPVSMVEPCIEAIYACNDEMQDKLIKLPEGVSWRGQDSAPANAIVEGHHLDAWVNHAWYCDCSDCIGDAE